MEIIGVAKELRSRLIDYRFSHKNQIVSIHINAIDIAVSLVEYFIKDKRPIELKEQNWFEASYQIAYVLSGSDWEDLSDLYSELVAEVRKNNFFR